MYKVCRTEQSARRQRELELVLLQMMLKRRYEDLSVSDLCESMQIPRKSFYRYFASKDGALFSLIDHTIGDFFQYPAIEKQGKSDAAFDLERFFVFWYERKDLLDALQRSNLSGILVARASAFTMQEGYLPRQFKRMSSEAQGMVMAFTVSGLMAMLFSWHRQGFRVTPGEMAKMAIEMLTKPMIIK